MIDFKENAAKGILTYAKLSRNIFTSLVVFATKYSITPYTSRQYYVFGKNEGSLTLHYIYHRPSITVFMEKSNDMNYTFTIHFLRQVKIMYCELYLNVVILSWVANLFS